MTDINPTPSWAAVRQLEIGEFALGGANGNMNEQAKSLAGQNMYSRLYAGLPFDPVFTAQVGGFPIGGKAALENGDIVRSTIASNVNNPNVNMTGWVNVAAWSSIKSKPTTVAGYGITDAYTKTEVDTAIANATPTIPDATVEAKGIVRLATESDITTSSENVAVTPKDVNNMLIGVGASARGFRALLSARLTEMVGTNTSTAKTITATITAHGLAVGDVIQINYRFAFSGNNQQGTDTVTVMSVTNANTFVFTSPRYAAGDSTGGTCTLSYVIKNNYNINSLTINAVGRYTISINAASGIIGTSFIPFVSATTVINSLIQSQPEVITSATSLTVRTFDKSGVAITPQWLHIGVTQ